MGPTYRDSKYNNIANQTDFTRFVPISMAGKGELPSQYASGGFDFGNPIFNLLAPLITGGRQMLPIGGTQESGGDHFRALERSKTSSEMSGAGRYDEFYKNPLVRQKYGEMAEQPMGRQLLNFMGVGGGNFKAATEMAQTYFSKGMADKSSVTGLTSIRSEMEESQKMVQSIQENFIDKNGDYSYKKSKGFNLVDSVKNVQTLRDLGIKGVNETLSGPMTEEKRENVKSLSSHSNEIMRQAKDTFGPGMSNEQMGDLMDKAMGGLQGIDASKASSLMDRIQSTSRALDMSGKAFAEYMAMQRRVYKQLGVTGETSANMIMNSALVGTARAKDAQKRGDVANSNVDDQVAWANANAIDAIESENSKYNQQLDSKMANFSDDYILPNSGGMTKREWVAKKKADYESGNSAGIDEANKMAIDTNQIGSEFENKVASKFVSKANRLRQESIFGQAANEFVMKKNGLEVGSEIRTLMLTTGGGQKAEADLNAAGFSIEGIQKEIGSVSDAKKVTKYLTEKMMEKDSSLSLKDAENKASALAAPLASVATDAENENANATGVPDPGQLIAAQDASSNAGIEQKDQIQKDQRRETNTQMVTRAITGEINSGLNLTALAEKSPKIFAKFKEIKAENKGEMLSLEQLGSLGKEFMDIAGNDELKKMAGFLDGSKESDKRMEDVFNAGEEAVTKEKKNTKGAATDEQLEVVRKKAMAAKLSEHEINVEKELEKQTLEKDKNKTPEQKKEDERKLKEKEEQDKNKTPEQKKEDERKLKEKEKKDSRDNERQLDEKKSPDDQKKEKGDSKELPPVALIGWEGLIDLMSQIISQLSTLGSTTITPTK